MPRTAETLFSVNVWKQSFLGRNNPTEVRTEGKEFLGSFTISSYVLGSTSVANPSYAIGFPPNWLWSVLITDRFQHSGVRANQGCKSLWAPKREECTVVNPLCCSMLPQKSWGSPSSLSQFFTLGFEQSYWVFLRSAPLLLNEPRFIYKRNREHQVHCWEISS